MASYYKKTSGDSYKQRLNTLLDDTSYQITKKFSQMDIENVCILNDMTEIVADMVSAIESARSDISNVSFRALKSVPSGYKD